MASFDTGAAVWTPYSFESEVKRMDTLAFALPPTPPTRLPMRPNLVQGSIPSIL